MNQNAGLPQTAPWVPTQDLVTPYQVLQNPLGRFAARRGRALRRGTRPRLRAATGPTQPLQQQYSPIGGELAAGKPDCPKGQHRCGTTWSGEAICCQNPEPNPTPLAWAGIGLGGAALAAAGAGAYAWRASEKAWELCQLDGEQWLELAGELTEGAKIGLTEEFQALAAEGVSDPDVMAEQAMRRLVEVYPATSESKCEFPWATVGKLAAVRSKVRAFAQEFLAGPQLTQRRVQNLSPLAWAGVGLGAAALAGGGYYLWQRQQEAALAVATGVSVDADCTKMTVTDPTVSVPYLNTFIDAAVEQLEATPVESLVVGAAYLQVVAPGCGVTVTEAGIEGVDTWQKGAMVGGLAMFVSGTLHDDGRMTDAEFKDQAEAIQAFLLEHGVDDLAMVEEVFEMPEETDTEYEGGGLAGAAEFGARAPNLGVLGMVGLGVAGLGVAAAGGAGYLWYRNRELTQACLGETTWLEADGSLSESAEAQLHTAILEAVADGAQNALEAADAAIVKVSGNPDCQLPVLIWGDLLRVRAATIAMAAHIGAFEDMEPPTEEGPGPDVTGIEADAACTKFTMHDQAKAEAYHNAFLDEQGLSPGQDWVPNTIVLGAAFLQRVAPHCGVSVSEGDPPEVMGVDTWQKAAMVGGFALMTNGALNDRGILSDADFSAQSQAIVVWLMEHGVDDLMMIEQVFPPPEEDAETDEWGEPVTNEVVNEGSVGGEGGGLYRVYKDNVGEYGGQFYFVIWRAGEYTEQGPFGTEAEASDGALDLLTGQQMGVVTMENPRRRRSPRASQRPPRPYSPLRNPADFLHLPKEWGATGRGGRLQNRMRARQFGRGAPVQVATTSVMVDPPSTRPIGAPTTTRRCKRPYKKFCSDKFCKCCAILGPVGAERIECFDRSLPGGPSPRSFTQRLRNPSTRMTAPRSTRPIGAPTSPRRCKRPYKKLCHPSGSLCMCCAVIGPKDAKMMDCYER